MTQGVATEQEAGDLVAVELECVLTHSTLQDVGLLGWRGLSLSDRQPRPLRGSLGREAGGDPRGRGHESAELLHQRPVLTTLLIFSGMSKCLAT